MVAYVFSKRDAPFLKIFIFFSLGIWLAPDHLFTDILYDVKHIEPGSLKKIIILFYVRHNSHILFAS
jgi:hypothetical protein